MHTASMVNRKYKRHMVHTIYTDTHEAVSNRIHEAIGTPIGHALSTVHRYCVTRKSIDAQGMLVDLQAKPIPTDGVEHSALASVAVVAVYKPYKLSGARAHGGGHAEAFFGMSAGRTMCAPYDSPHGRALSTFKGGGWPYVCQLVRNYGNANAAPNACAMALYTVVGEGGPTLVGVGFGDSKSIAMAKGKVHSNSWLGTKFVVGKAWHDGTPALVS